MARHRPLSKYARVAQQISDAISQTESLLKDLSNLATKKHITVEDDPTKQISDIVEIVKKSIPPMLKDIETFEGAVAGDVRPQEPTAKALLHCLQLPQDAHVQLRQGFAGTSVDDDDNDHLVPEGMQTRASVIKKQSERRTKFGFTGQAPSVQISTPLTIRNKLQAAPTPSSYPTYQQLSQQ
ncbi:hypothetical protein AaE_009126, partial [Aphanomyces astaci]